MKLSVVFLSLFLGISSVVNSNQIMPDEIETPERLSLPIDGQCDEFDLVVLMLLKKYGEKPLVAAPGLVPNLITNDFMKGDFIIFVNPKTGTFTLAFNPDDKMNYVCIIGTGAEPSLLKLKSDLPNGISL